MPDLARLHDRLAASFPENWVRHHLASFSAAYFATFDEEEVAAHLGQMIALGDDRPVSVRARPLDPDEWRVEVVGNDAFQFLSTLCALLAIRGFSILHGHVFTSQPPAAPSEPVRRLVGRPGPPRPRVAAGPDRRRRIVDRFTVRRIAGDDTPVDWDEFEKELSALTRLLRADRYEEVHRRLLGRLADALGRHRPESAPLEPLELDIDPSAAEWATVVRIGARDNFGFLTLTASALALCGIVILEADIRTHDGRADDTLWVVDRSGRKITDADRIRELRLSLILIEHFSSQLHHATNPEAALVHFSRFVADTMAHAEWARDFAALDRPEVLDALVRVLGESEFLWEEYLHAQPDNLLPMICDPAEWNLRPSPKEMAERLSRALSGAVSAAEQALTLKRFKDHEIFRADIRAILGLSGGLTAFSEELSDVAEVLLEAAYHIAITDAAHGRTPHPPVSSVLCALGKCGGRELGFASDLELMLIYADTEDDTGAVLGVHFDRIVAALGKLLSGRRGGTFEVDFRLRPYGKGGAPATALTTFRNYYQAGGPAWGYERQALIKLRVIAGDPALGRAVEAHRDCFVYGPEPFDLEGWRRMRRLQVEQLVRPGNVNAKFSPGALVDVEYLVQALQISWGHDDAALRTPNTLAALAAVRASGRLSPERVSSLGAAYEFFRALTDGLRMVHGHSKDLTVPDPRSEEFARLARRMRLADAESLRIMLQQHLAATKQLTERLADLIVAPQA